VTATILLVDDEPDLEALVLQKFRRQIREGAFSFVSARDGVEALAVLDANPGIDLVVSDINMPRMDGLSLLQSFRIPTISSPPSLCPPMATSPTSAPR